MSVGFVVNQKRRLSCAVTIALITILWLGFGLRMFQLGHDSFWNDEAGQALAAIQPTLRQMFAIEKAHAMAMPLDYLVSRLFSHIGLSETILRFPAVIWGMLTLVVCFNLVRRITRLRVALLATFLLGISVLQVHYSQEARFYSALTFFFAFSTYLLLRAIDRSSLFRWAVFALASIVGVYFHPFVALSVLNGFLYLLVVRPVGWRGKQLRVLIMLSVLIAVFFLPGYIYFGSHQQYEYDLLQWHSSIVQAIAQGMEWIAYPHSSKPISLEVWRILNFWFFLIGLLSVIIRRDVQSMCLLLGIPLQIALIILADWMKGYWFISRQLIYLHPISLMFTATGAIAASEFISKPGVIRYFLNRSPICIKFSSLILMMIVALMGLSSVPVLEQYYKWPKSTARDIAKELVQRDGFEKTIRVIPGYEEKIYRFYFQVLGAEPKLTAALQPTDWNSLEQSVTLDLAETYLITPAVLTVEQRRKLQRLGFVPLLRPDIERSGAQTLYKRAEIVE
jgi:hypothetical protein